MSKEKLNNCYLAEEVEIARFCKAFSHPARLAILRLLMNSKGYYVNDLVEQLPISQSSVSQHLKELKSVDIVRSEYLPPKVRYTFNEQVFEKFKDFQTKYYFEDIFQIKSKD